MLSRGSFRQLRRGFGEGGALPGSSQKLQGVICNAVTLWQINIDPENAKFRGSGGFGAEKNEKMVERKKKDLRFFPCPGQASASAPYCS